MRNPWEEIRLEEYEAHMRLDSVRQLQAIDAMMKGQLAAFPAETALILGVAAGTGLEHVDRRKIRRIYGVDINRDYLAECAARYPDLEGVLTCIPADLLAEDTVLPYADLVIANLLIEYIGYACFQRVIRQIAPKAVSCAIQINPEDGFVSDSPYLHIFDGLARIHHELDGQGLTEAMAEIGYLSAGTEEAPLPNGKKLMRLDFLREGTEREEKR